MNVDREEEDDWITIRFCENDYLRTFMNKISSLKSNHLTCDVVINSNEKRIYAHKIILAAHSPYFHNVFYGEFREAQKTNALMEIDLNQFQPKLVEAAIDNMYSTDTRIPMNPSNIAEFLCLVSFLQYSHLENYTSKTISEDVLIPETSLLFLTLSIRINDAGLQSRAFYSLKTHFQVVLDTELFVKQDIDMLKMLLKQDDLNIDSEYTMFEAVVKWVTFDLDARLAYLTELLDYVRFEHIESGMISEAVLNHHLVKNSELLLSEIHLYFLNCKAFLDGSRFVNAADESRAEADPQHFVRRKQRSYPEELIVFARHQSVRGNPLEKYWLEKGLNEWFDSCNIRCLSFKWRTELYRVGVSAGFLEEFNVFIEFGYWQEVPRCELFQKEFEKARQLFQSRANLIQLHVIGDALFYAFQNC